jgi:hypothetical protein
VIGRRLYAFLVGPELSMARGLRFDGPHRVLCALKHGSMGAKAKPLALIIGPAALLFVEPRPPYIRHEARRVACHR